MEVFFYDDTYKDQLIDFLRKVWDPKMTESLLQDRRDKNISENPYAKVGGFPIAIAIQDDVIIGHHAGTPSKVWINKKEVLSYWLAGLHVLPEGRRKGVAKALQNTTNKLPMATSFWVIEATLRVKKRLGWTVVGKIPEYIKILDPNSMLYSLDYDNLPKMRFNFDKLLRNLFPDKSRVASGLFKLSVNNSNKLFKYFLNTYSIKSQIKHVETYDDGIDKLWEKNRGRIKFSHVRNSKYMNWQFKREHGWIKIVAEKEGTISGYAILSLKTIKKVNYIKELRALSVIDIFWDFEQTEILWDMLQYIEKMGQKHNVSILICSINNKTAQKTLLMNGYFRIPGTVYFGFHSHKYGQDLSANLDDWFITRGDGDAAGSLGPTLPRINEPNSNNS